MKREGVGPNVIKIKPPRNNWAYYPRDKNERLRGRGGIYYIYSESSDELLYIGKTNDLRSRLHHHFFHKTGDLVDYQHDFSYAVGFFCEEEVERDIYETHLINTLQPPLNKHKTYTYNTSRNEERFFTAEKLKKQADTIDYINNNVLVDL